MDKPLVCANPDYVAYVGLPQPVVCEGMLAAYYEKIGGKVAWFGKPEVDIYEHLLQDYDVPRSRVLMLGIRCAQTSPALRLPVLKALCFSPGFPTGND